MTSVVAGAIAGWLAGRVMKDGGYGLTGDMILGFVGSIVGSWIFQALGISPEARMVVLVLVAFVGVAVMFRLQRKIWRSPLAPA